MRAIGVVVVLLLLLAGLGFYMGWFRVSADRAATPREELNVNLKVDTQELREDAAEAKERVREIGRAVQPDEPDVDPARQR